MSSRPKRSTRRPEPRRIDQIHVALQAIHPTVWRRLWVPDILTLAKLDRVIQAAVAWTHSHLLEFVMAGRRYGIPDDESLDDAPLLDGRKFTVGTVLGESVREFFYVYDFGDPWQHQVNVQDVLLPNPINTGPVCIAGQNAGPPGDVGGVGGCAAFLEAIQNPEHDQRDAMWNWCGGPSTRPASTSTGPTPPFERIGSDSMSRQQGRSHPVRRTAAPVRARTRARSGHTVIELAASAVANVLRRTGRDPSIGPPRRDQDAHRPGRTVSRAR